jgi:heterodisulfide reductase subunit A2
MPNLKSKYDALVIGAGIAGMQCSLDLANQGFSVLLVEKQPSIGGIMVGLNKVFPTLDCSSCICTPRMAETAHHPKITIQTYTEVQKVDKKGCSFTVQLLKKPRYVIEDKCIGCSECELVCPVDVPHEFDYGLGARRAVYIPHSNSIPMIAALDVDNCIFCGKCASKCPTEAIDFLQKPEEISVEAGAVVISSGLNMTAMNIKPEYGDGKLPNVMNPLAMERLQASDGPYGHVIRPSDGKIPKSIAYIKCAGSRDQSIGIPYCSRVCCMYSMKQAILTKQKDPSVEITLYHMDIRAFGKGYEQFYRRALNEGIKIIKAKVAKVTEDEEHNPIVRVELLDEGGRVAEVKHDLIVLASGIIPGWQPGDHVPAQKETDGFFRTPFAKIRPTLSTTEGIFLAGVSTGPKDIPDAIVEAGAAAMEAANYLVKNMASATVS